MRPAGCCTHGGFLILGADETRWPDQRHPDLELPSRQKRRLHPLLGQGALRRQVLGRTGLSLILQFKPFEDRCCCFKSLARLALAVVHRFKANWACLEIANVSKEQLYHVKSYEVIVYYVKHDEFINST